MDFTDKHLTCTDCKAPFVFTAGEQRWYEEKGFEREPRRCPECRKSRKPGGDSGGRGGGESRGRGARGGGGGGDRQKFSVTCTACGAKAEVPFQPRPNSPVYCSSCYQARRG